MEKESHTPEFDPFAGEEKRSPAGARGLVGWMALLLALGALGLSGWQWWSNQSNSDADLRLDAAIAEAAQARQGLEAMQADLDRRIRTVESLELSQKMAQLDGALERSEGIAGSDRARLEAMEADQAAVLNRVEGLESGLAAVVVRGESPRQALELAEVDYLLRSANERLQLFSDPRSADQALLLADRQLAASDDPVYLPVRQSIARSRLAIEEVPRPDVVGITENIDRLQQRTGILPFDGEVRREEEGVTVTEEDQGVWARFKRTMSELVTVQRRDPEALLLTLEDKATVRQGLWLQLESARLAVLRRDDAAYQSAIDRATSTLEQYFAMEELAVQQTAEGLARLRQTNLRAEWPDISEPWIQLQRIRAIPPTAVGSNADSEPANTDVGVPPMAAPPASATDAGSSNEPESQLEAEPSSPSETIPESGDEGE